MIEGNETAPGGVCAPYAEGLDANKERPMTSVSDRRRIAAEFLTRAADDHSRASTTRARYAVLARQYGLTFGEIGTFLGVTEDAAQIIVQQEAA